jgi:hypothetical protein
MNFDDTLKQMLSAAAAAAKVHWNDFRSYAEQEFKRLAEAGAQVEADYAADVAEAQLQQDATKRDKLIQKAKLRAQLAFENLRLASEGVLTATTADAKIAAQDAINAALGVLGAAINKSIGIALL